MRYVSIEALKRDLSGIIREASEGSPVVVTRHNRPVATISAADLEHVHVGSRVGQSSLAPALRRATRGRYLAVLAEDREDDRAPG